VLETKRPVGVGYYGKEYANVAAGHDPKPTWWGESWEKLRRNGELRRGFQIPRDGVAEGKGERQ